MTSTNIVYMEADSTFRNRNAFPLSSSFDLITTTTGRADARSALDPVSLAAPVKAWVSNNFADAIVSNSISVTVVETVGTFGSTATPAVYEIRSTIANQLKTIDQYYRRAALVSNADPTVRSRIVFYEYLANDRAKITIEPPVPFVDGDVLIVYDSTDTATALRLFVPTGSLVENAYAGYILYNDTRNTSATIESYEPETGTVQYASNAGTAAWTNTDSYSLRRNLPRFTGTTAAGSTPTSVNLGAVGVGQVDLVGSFVYYPVTLAGTSPSGEARRIVAYNATTGNVTVSPAFGANPTGIDYQILQFSYDNFNPYSYPYTQSTGPNPYKVGLVHLSVPDLPLSNTGGGRPSQQPFVYVSLVTADTKQTPLLFSNNPFATSEKATFKAYYKNFTTTTPGMYGVPNNVTGGTAFSGVASGSTRAQFYSDLTRVMTMRIDGSFTFKVLLPNGEALRYVSADRYSPVEPDPELQIIATFSIQA